MAWRTKRVAQLRCAIVLAVVVASGCGISRPTLKFKTAHLRDLSLEGTTLDLVYALKNPHPIGLTIDSVAYALEVEGHPVVSGQPPQGVSVAASRTTDLSFPATVKFASLAPVLSVFLDKDDARYRASGHLGVQTPIGLIKLPLSHEDSFPVPKIPRFEFRPPSLASMSLTGAQVIFPIEVTNRNAFGLPLSGFSANFHIAGANVGGTEASLPGMLAGGEKRLVSIPVNVNFLRAGAAAAQALRNRSATVRLEGSLRSGAVALPITLSEQLSFR